MGGGVTNGTKADFAAASAGPDTQLYVVEAVIDQAAPLKDSINNTDKLGAEIANLAKETGDYCWFHRYTDDTLGGAPNILLECHSDFLEKVKELPSCASAEPYDQKHETERSHTIKVYFEGEGKKRVEIEPIASKGASR